MSLNESDTIPGWMVPPPSHPTISSETKLFLKIGIGCAVMILLCAGGLMSFSAFMSFWFYKAKNSDPETVRAVTNELIDIEIPEGFVPHVSFKLKAPLVSRLFTCWALYADQQTDSSLVLALVTDPSYPLNQTKIRLSVEQSLQEQGEKVEAKNLLGAQMRQKNFHIGGDPATFIYTTGKNPQTKTARIQVSGLFKGKSGMVLLLMSADANKYDDEVIERMIASMADSSGQESTGSQQQVGTP